MTPADLDPKALEAADRWHGQAMWDRAHHGPGKAPTVRGMTEGVIRAYLDAARLVPAVELEQARVERDEMRKAAPDADVAYWQDRCLDHATALDCERIVRKQAETELEQARAESRALAEALREIVASAGDRSRGQLLLIARQALAAREGKEAGDA